MLVPWVHFIGSAHPGCGSHFAVDGSCWQYVQGGVGSGLVRFYWVRQKLARSGNVESVYSTVRPNMKRSHAIIISVIAIALASAIVWSLVKYAGLQASLLWTAIIGAAAWAIRSNIERKREHQKLLAERKTEHYLQFLEFLARFLSNADKAAQGSSTSGKTADSEIVDLEEFRMWSLRLTLIGSDEVVKAWNSARLDAVANQAADRGVQVLRNWGRLWLAMRKDCGHLDTKLSVSDVLASFVNDIEENRASIDRVQK